jgi:tetratricopeptide (TPR) repeat protein
MMPLNQKPNRPAHDSPVVSDRASPQPAELPFAGRQHGWLAIAFILAATFLVYAPVWHAGFIWDDDVYITGNTALRSWHGLRQIWFETDATPQYYPLTFTTFWVEYHLWGLNPLGYHLTNVLLHAFDAALLALLLRYLRVPGAWLAAALFALHPVCVESVAWATERKNTLALLFFLSSALAAFRFWLPELQSTATSVGSRTSTRGNRPYYWLALVLYVCALLSKSATAPLPVVILMIIWWKSDGVQTREVWSLVPFVVIGTASGLVTMIVERHLGAGGAGWQLPLQDRCVVAARDFWFYLGKILWPVPLAFTYPRWEIDPRRWLDWLPLVALLAGFLTLWKLRHGRARPVLIAAGYFLALLLPVSSFVNIYYFRHSFVADHFQYLACIGPLSLLAAGIAVVLRPLAGSRPAVIPVLCGGLLLILGTWTWQQCRIYFNPVTLWSATALHNPGSYLVQCNLGVALLEGDLEGTGPATSGTSVGGDSSGTDPRLTERLKAAEFHLRRALELHPEYEDAHRNLGNALLAEGRLDEAIDQYSKALEIKPDFPQAHYSLGIALFRKGQVDAAIDELQKALQLVPGYAAAHATLGDAFLQQGHPDRAVAEYQRALDIQPDLAAFHLNLGTVLFQEGRMEEAASQYRRALELQPEFAAAHYDLGNILLGQGKVEEAMSHYRKALEKQPGFAQAHYNLGNALVREGRVDDAVAEYEKSLQLEPGNAAAHGVLGDAFLKQGHLDRAVTEYQQALQLAPSAQAREALRQAAWRLATSADGSERNGSRAVEIALDLNGLSGGNDPAILGTLAAAYAEVGRFPDAIATAGKACALASASGDKVLEGKNRQLLELYRTGQPYHQQAGRPE